MTRIPRDHPALRAALALIPPDLHDSVWVGGSAATRFPRNADLDLWLSVPRADERRVRNALIGAPGNSIADILDPQEIQDYSGFSHLLFVGQAADLPVHILLADADMEEVVAEFDCAVHAAAVRALGEELIAPGYSTRNVLSPTSTPRDPAKTLRRLFRFGERYQQWEFLEDADQHTFTLMMRLVRLGGFTPRQLRAAARLCVGEGL